MNEKVIRGHVVTAAAQFADGYVAVENGKVVRVGDASAGLPEADTPGTS